MKKLLLLAVMFSIFAGASLAQDTTKDSPKEPPKAEKPADTGPLGAYKLDFVFRELQDGKTVNTRNYMMILEDSRGSWGEIKIGSRVPVVTGNVPNAWQYLDIGTNINCRVGNKIQRPLVPLNCTVEVSSFSLPEQKSTAAGGNPVVNQIKSNVPAVVAEGKQTVITTIDDPSSTRRYEIALTATKVE